ncbi:hypothetical protein BH23ACI1_BH23ACI1_24790 [soil metagenome]|nr:DUF4920 domain-containing protein [Acidobacteriota bacterium]
MKLLLTGVALCALLVVPALAEETKLGAGVSIKEATPIATVLGSPNEFVGKTIRVDGVATAVCEDMGCWMSIAPEGNAEGATVRIKVEDGVIVFPVSAKGKKVSAEGVWEVVGASGHGAAAEHAPNAAKKYQLKATGAVIR